MNMSLPAFIASVGDDEAARMFRVAKRTVQSWRRRERIPRPEMARALISASGGVLTMQGIYETPSGASAKEA